MPPRTGTRQGTSCLEALRDLGCCSPQNVRGARTVGYVPRRAVYREWNQPERASVMQSAVVATSSVEVQVLEFALPRSGLNLAQHFHTMPPLCPFGMVIYSLCHCVLEVHNLCFYFTGGYN